MTEANVLQIGRDALLTALMLSLPILIAGLVIGVAVSVFQAVTQVQEVTLSYVPKMLAAVAVLAVFGHWMLSKAVFFTKDTFTQVTQLTK